MCERAFYFQLAGVRGPGLHWQNVFVRTGELPWPEGNGLRQCEILHPVAADRWLCKFTLVNSTVHTIFQETMSGQCESGPSPGEPSRVPVSLNLHYVMHFLGRSFRCRRSPCLSAAACGASGWCWRMDRWTSSWWEAAAESSLCWWKEACEYGVNVKRLLRRQQVLLLVPVCTAVTDGGTMGICSWCVRFTLQVWTNAEEIKGSRWAGAASVRGKLSHCPVRDGPWS